MTAAGINFRWVIETLPRLQHGNAVPLLGQPQRRDAATEPRTDDNDVEISLRVHHELHCARYSRTPLHAGTAHKSFAQR